MNKTTQNSTIKQNFENACNAYIKAFCEKHGYDYNSFYYAGDDPGSIVELADYSIDLQTIRTDIDRDAPKYEFIAWYDYCLRLGALRANTPNYEHWLMECPRKSESEIKHLEQQQAKIEELKEQLDEQINQLNKTKDEHNSNF